MWEYFVKSIKKSSPQESSAIHPVHKPVEPSIAQKLRLHEESSDYDRSGERASHESKKRILDCPVCHISMQIKRIGGVEIDKCPKCAGIFLDKGELATLSRSSVEIHSSVDREKDFLIYTPHGLTPHVKGP